MQREQAKELIKDNWREILRGRTGEAKQRVNGEASYICPICGHGSNGDGLTKNPQSTDPNGLKCFGCNFSGDIIDLIMQAEGLQFNEALNTLAAEIGIDIETADNYTKKDTKAPQIEKQRPTEQQLAEYYTRCRQRLTPESPAAAYLAARGIALELAASWGIGFDPEADPAQSGYKQPRLIIPTSPTHYVARRIDNNPDYKAMNNKGGKVGILNEAALYAPEAQEVFVVEGWADALSIVTAGGAAVALNSANNAKLLIEHLEQKPTAATIIICKDNDNAGQTAADTLNEGLKRLNISHIEANINCGYKDANEALQQNKEAFIEAVKEAKHQAEPRPDNVSYYIDNIMAGEVDRFKNDIKTGFANLDEVSGGVYSGLYVIAAISSLGKTTFAAQLADNFAAAGNDVLFFSMEQSRLEMISKSLARRTYINNPATAVSSLAIRKGYLPQQVLDAAAQYKQEVQEHISVIEGNFDCSISYIGNYVRQYMRRNKEARPIVFIDYLQVLQPEVVNNRTQNTKETIDSTITELKRLSRELNITVFVISSVNRANYLTPIDFEALKESGSIEFTADVIWGLQLQCLQEELFEKDKHIKEKRQRIKAAKAANPRKIELACLKNRYGIANYSAYFDYYPANDYFKVCNDAAIAFAPDPEPGNRL